MTLQEIDNPEQSPRPPPVPLSRPKIAMSPMTHDLTMTKNVRKFQSHVIDPEIQ